MSCRLPVGIKTSRYVRLTSPDSLLTVCGCLKEQLRKFDFKVRMRMRSSQKHWGKAIRRVICLSGQWKVHSWQYKLKANTGGTSTAVPICSIQGTICTTIPLAHARIQTRLSGNDKKIEGYNGSNTSRRLEGSHSIGKFNLVDSTFTGQCLFANHQEWSPFGGQ